MDIITPLTTLFAETGIGGAVRLYGNDSSRVVTIFTVVSAGSQLWLCLKETGLIADSVLDISPLGIFELRQHDYGELANHELWICDGVGNAPTCNLLVTELLLT